MLKFESEKLVLVQNDYYAKLKILEELEERVEREKEGLRAAGGASGQERKGSFSEVVVEEVRGAGERLSQRGIEGERN